METSRRALSIATLFAVLIGSYGAAALAAEPVTLDTFVRAETDTAMRVIHDRVGIGAFEHLRQPTSLDENGTRYAYLIVRTFVDAGDPEDIAIANALQDKLQVKGGGSELEIPDWDQNQLRALREALNAVAAFGTDTARAFGSEDAVEPIHHLVGAASGWGGNPPQEATSDLRYVEKDDGTPYVLSVGEVPVDAFWSATLYDTDAARGGAAIVADRDLNGPPA